MAKAFERDDPFAMVGVFLPVEPDQDAAAEMARVFIEEFALMGFSAERILRLFKSPFYASAHLLYQQRGEAFVRESIDQVLRPAGGEEGCA